MRYLALVAILAISLVAILVAPGRFGVTPATADAEPRCHPSYPDVCLPPPPPDLNCDQIRAAKPIRVRHDVANPDPHRLDRDRDGLACESGARPRN